MVPSHFQSRFQMVRATQAVRPQIQKRKTLVFQVGIPLRLIKAQLTSVMKAQSALLLRVPKSELSITILSAVQEEALTLRVLEQLLQQQIKLQVLISVVLEMAPLHFLLHSLMGVEIQGQLRLIQKPRMLQYQLATR